MQVAFEAIIAAFLSIHLLKGGRLDEVAQNILKQAAQVRADEQNC